MNSRSPISSIEPELTSPCPAPSAKSPKTASLPNLYDPLNNPLYLSILSIMD